MSDLAVMAGRAPSGGELAQPAPGSLRRFLRLPTAVAGLGLTGATALVAVLAPVLAAGDPFATVAEPFLRPSMAHPMGTDDLGRDLLRAVMHGARTSMVVVVAVVVASSVIGIVIGVLAGYRGRLADDVLMRVTDMFQAVPRFFLAILAVALLGPGTGNLILILSVTSWPWLARVVRAETKSLKERSFVDAARVLGADDRRIVVHHVLPHVLPSIMVLVSLTAARVILLEASLGFLGLGDPNAMSWGYLANNSQRFLRSAWWMSFFPGAAIIVAVLGFTLLGDAVTDLRDPSAATGRRRSHRARPEPARARRTARWLAPVGVAAVVLVTAAVVWDGDRDRTRPAEQAEAAGTGSPVGTTLAELEAGDCFDQPPDGATEVVRVPCTEAHTDEVYAVIILDGGRGARYPTQIDDQADGRCYNEFVTFVGADPRRSTFTYDWYPPTEAAWARGERRVPCVVADPEGTSLTGPA